MIDAHDITLARVKIFALTAAILNHQKLGAPSPKNLQKFSKLLTSDPFTGAPLGYKVEEKKFLIYSTGIDCKDDAGKTDGAFSSPDLTLEVAP